MRGGQLHDFINREMKINGGFNYGVILLLGRLGGTDINAPPPEFTCSNSISGALQS